MNTGVVRYINYEKGYGFIVSKELANDSIYFPLNKNKKWDTIRRDDVVEFEVVQTADQRFGKIRNVVSNPSDSYIVSTFAKDQIINGFVVKYDNYFLVDRVSGYMFQIIKAENEIIDLDLLVGQDVQAKIYNLQNIRKPYVAIWPRKFPKLYYDLIETEVYKSEITELTNFRAVILVEKQIIGAVNLERSIVKELNLSVGDEVYVEFTRQTKNGTRLKFKILK